MDDLSSRQDLDNALAVIAVDPGYMVMTQRGPEAQTEESWKETSRNFHTLMDELEAEIVRRAPPGMLSQQSNFPRHYYQIGPAAQGPTVELSELLQNAHSIIETVVTYLDLGTFAFQLREWWMHRTGKSEPYGPSDGALVFTAPFIEGMCVADVLKRHGETLVTRVQSHSREEFFSSPSHPTGFERYTVTISVTSQRHYVYTIDGTGTVYDHYLMNNGETTPLDTPPWKGTSAHRMSRKPVRPHRARIGRD